MVSVAIISVAAFVFDGGAGGDHFGGDYFGGGLFVVMCCNVGGCFSRKGLLAWVLF